jgi:hypothetical protein
LYSFPICPCGCERCPDDLPPLILAFGDLGPGFAECHDRASALFDLGKSERGLACPLVETGDLMSKCTQRRVEARDKRGEVVDAAVAQLTGCTDEPVESEQSLAEPALGVTHLFRAAEAVGEEPTAIALAS